MFNLGEYNTLKAIRFKEQGCYVGDESQIGQEAGGVLLPNQYVPEGLSLGDDIEVYIYHDSEDRLVATTEKPHIVLHQFAPLTVLDVTGVGVFMDWGIQKNLFVPFAEQGRDPMIVGGTYVIFLYIDTETSRLVGSAAIDKIIDNEEVVVKEGDEVDLIVYRESPLGYMAIINNENIGLIYRSDIYQKIDIGESCRGWIKKIREDGKIDLSLYKQGHLAIEENAKILLEKLKAKGGHLPFTDKSDPQAIREALNMSKKNFKKAVGSLYKQRIVELKADGIHISQQTT